MIFKYSVRLIAAKNYITGWRLISENGVPSEEYEFTKPLSELLRDENDRFQWTIQDNPDYDPEVDHIDVRYIIENDPISPPVPTEQEVENALRAETMAAGTELNIKDENGDVRWRIIPNEEGKLQIEIDPIDQPHIGEWLLNGEMGHPKLQDGQLMICLDGELQAISIAELKELMDEI